MRVSVVIAARDAEPFLAEALDSVLAQSLPAHEILLLLDDRTADRSAAVAAGRPRVRTIPTATRSHFAAMNEGVALATGDAIAFLSADDRWRPGKLERQAAAMGADGAFSITWMRFFLHGGVAWPRVMNPALRDRDLVARLPESLLARRDALARVGPFRPELGHSADVDWFARAKDMGLAPRIVPEVLLEKRIHGGNLSLDTARVHESLFAALRDSVRRQRVSVVIPVRNGAAFLADALDSASGQADEIVVVDDGSTDGSSGIAASRGVRVVGQGASGAGPARNAGVAAATGDLIAFLDADDRWTRGSVAARLEALDAETDLVYGVVREFADASAPPGAVARPPAAAAIPSSVLLRRAAFERTGGFPPDAPGAEAVAWYANALAKGLRVRVVPFVVCERRLHAGNVGRAGAREAMLRAVQGAVARRREAP